MDFEITVGDTTYNLNDGAPFRFSSFTDVSSSEVVRLSRRSSTADSIIDLGYRLTPRTMQLALHFYASTAAILDTYRDTLAEIFKPTTDYPLQLRVERDDGTARTLNCHTVGEVVIDLEPGQYASKLHRATITLRSAFPAYKAASSTTASLSGSAADWWTAGGLIGTANVLEHVEYPTQAQAFAYAGTATGDWSVVFRSGQETNTIGRTAFRIGTASNINDPKLWRYSVTSWSLTTSNTLLSDLPAGTQNYMYVFTDAGGLFGRVLYHAANTELLSLSDGTDASLIGTAGAWRGDKTGAGTTLWTNEFPKAALYNVALSSAQRIALDAHMSGTATLGTISAVNSGDLPVYPYITLRGPMVNPIITNVTTGKVIDLVGLTLGSADTYYIDLTGGDKTILNLSGSSQLATMGTPTQLAEWYLAPSPIATGGTNSIRVQGGSTSTATRVEILYHNQYMSY